MTCKVQSCCPPSIFDNPIPKQGDQVFFNTYQEATACCPEGFFSLVGGCKTAHIDAGLIPGTTQQEADENAYGAALAKAQSQLECDCGNLIPDMIDYDAPSGEVIYSSDFSAAGYYAWHAFDGELDNDHYWHSFGADDPAYIGYHFPSATVVQTYRIYPYGNTGAGDNPTAWMFQGSNDGIVWDELDEQINITTWTVGVPNEFSFTNTNAYAYYRLNIVEVEHNRDPFNIPGLTPAVAELQMFGCIPELFFNRGVDPILRYGPPVNFELTLQTSPAQPRGFFTVPDVLVQAEISLGVIGAGTPPGLAVIDILNYDGGTTTVRQDNGTPGVAGDIVTLSGGSYRFVDTASDAGRKLYWATDSGVLAKVATIVTVTDSTHAVVDDSKTVVAGQFAIIPPGNTLKLWVRDSTNGGDFQEQSIGGTLGDYALWIDGTGGPGQGEPNAAPSYPLRIAAHIDEFYNTFDTTFYFFLEFVAGGQSWKSEIMSINVPIPP